MTDYMKKRPKPRKRTSGKISSKRLVRLAERVLGGYVPTRAEAKSLAGCVLSQAKGKRK